MSEKYNIPEPNSLDSMEGVGNLDQNRIVLKHENENIGPAVEKDISQQDIQNVMNKVVNIWASRFGFHSLHAPQSESDFNESIVILNSILIDGLLGIFNAEREHIKDEFKDLEPIKKFMHFARKKRTGVVMGNIIGRDIGKKRDSDFGIFGYWSGPISILFDVSSKEETLPGMLEEEDYDKKFQKTNINQMWQKEDSISYDDSMLDRDEFEALRKVGIIVNDSNVSFVEFKNQIDSKAEELKSMINFEKLTKKINSFSSYEDLFTPPHSDNGFVLGRRISPRKFEGIIWRALDSNSFNSPTEEDERQIDKIVETFRFVSKENGKKRYLPIYDQFGNLWWPKKISNDEIVKMKVPAEQK